MKKIISLLTMLLISISVLSQTSQPKNTGITGSGTANSVPMFINSKKIGDSPIKISSTNVGIGTLTPTSKLHVVGSGLFTDLNVGGVDNNYSLTLIGKPSGMVRLINSSFADVLNIYDNGGITFGSSNTRIGINQAYVSNTTLNIHAFDNGNSNYTFYISNFDYTKSFSVKNNGTLNLIGMPTSSVGLTTGDLFKVDNGDGTSTIKIVN